MRPLLIATRKSPLALVQAEMVAARLRETLSIQVDLLPLVTTGDRQATWSLEGKGGKGLFTGELEAALLRGEADIAVHSTKDLPGELTPGLVVAGYLPREDPRDLFIVREGVAAIASIATGSPRRRRQVARLHPGAAFDEIRGNVDTRLRKIAQDCVADATILAAAGLKRLGIHRWDGLRFQPFSLDQMVPAVGQGAIGVQCRTADAARYAPLLDQATFRALAVERALQAALGSGCHTAFAAHVAGDTLHLFHEDTGLRTFELSAADFAAPAAAAARVLGASGLK